MDDKLITATKSSIFGYDLSINENDELEFKICLTAEIAGKLIQVRFLSETKMVIIIKNSDKYPTLCYLMISEPHKFIIRTSEQLTDHYQFLETYLNDENEAITVIGTKNKIMVYRIQIGTEVILINNDYINSIDHLNIEILSKNNLTINCLKYIIDEFWIGSTQLISFKPIVMKNKENE